jgi:transcriptional regulator with XRE-family HTH domain
MTVGERLREVRLYLCLTLDEAGQRSGVHAQLIGAIERGAAEVDELDLQRLARAYGHPAAYFVHGGADRGPAGGPARLLGDLTEHDTDELDRFVAFLQDSADCA